MSNKFLRAELWDQMHYFIRCHNDHMVHYFFEYDGCIDTELLKRSLQIFLDAEPVLRSRFVITPLRPFWHICEASADDIMHIFDTETPYEDALSFLRQDISIDSPVQLRMGLFRCGRRQILTMLVNHMCFDADDGRYFLHMLCRNYNALAENLEPDPVRCGSRAFERIYDDLNFHERLHAKTLFRYRKSNIGSPVFPLSPAGSGDHNMLLIRHFDADMLINIRRYAREHGATVNDLLTAAIISVLYDMCGYDKGKPMSVACAVDLRRHMNDRGKSTGLTNHVAFYDCSTDRHNDNFQQLLAGVKASMDAGKADRYVGMYALPLLNLACRVLPLCLSDLIVPHVYRNPTIEISNIGHISVEECSFCDAHLVSGHVTGATKRKPMLFLSITRFESELVFSTALYGNEDDAAIINCFFDRLTLLFGKLG